MQQVWMAQGDEDRWFERWRRTGDAVALADVFDRTAGEVWRVAVHLAPDLDAADDLVQSTFLDALQHAGEWDARRALLPWLLGILQNRARRLQRDRARERERRAASPSSLAELEQPGEDPPSRAHASELEHRLLLAIDELPSAWQPVAVLHLRFGHTPTEIAVALQRAPGTVRSQLRRALARLRNRLPQGFMAGVVPAIGARSLPANVREVVLREGARLARGSGVGSAAAITSVVVGGGIAMKKGWLVVCALSFVAVALWFSGSLLGDGRTPAPIADAVPAPRSAALHEVRPERAQREPAAPSQRSAIARPSASQATGRLLVRVHWSDGAAAEAIGVDGWPHNGRDQQLQAIAGVTDARGELCFQEIASGAWTVLIDRGERRVVDVPSGGTARLELRLADAIDVQGAVVGPDGAPVLGAEVWVSDAMDVAHRAARTDAAGAFALRDLPVGTWIEARDPQHAPSPRRVVLPPPAPEVPRNEVHAYPDRPVVLQLGPSGAGLAGLVLGADGRPVAAAAIGLDLVAGGGTQAMQPGTRTDQNGRFSLRGLPAAPVWLGVRAVGHAPHRECIDLTVATVQDRTVRLTAGGVLRGTVRDADGLPVAGALVSAGRVPARMVARTGVDGAFAFAEVASGELPVAVASEGFVTIEHWLRIDPDAEPVIHDFVLEREVAVRGVVTDRRGGALAGWTVLAHDRFAPGIRSAETGADGAFELQLDGSCGYRIAVRAPGAAVDVECEELGVVTAAGANDDPLAIVVGDAHLPTASVRGRLVVEGATALAGALVVPKVGIRQVQGAIARAGSDGTFHIGPLPPHEYRLEVVPADRALPRFTIPGFELEPYQVLDLGEVAAPTFGTLHWRFRAADGGALPPFHLDVEGPSWKEYQRDVAAEGSLRVAPGPVLVRVWSRDGVLAHEFDVVIDPVGATLLEAVLRRAVRRSVRLALPDGELAATFVLTGQNGETIYEEELHRAGEPIAFRFPLLPRGTITVTVTGDSGSRYRGAFTVPGLVPEPTPLTFTLERVD